MNKYDYIVVGGGAAGCVLAARLSEDPAVTVLLLESGSERQTPLLSVPAGEVLLMGNPAYDWCFETESDPTLHQRVVQIPRGRLLGGSNTINGLIFVRGQRQDFDEWAKNGNPGWAWSDVLPYFRKLECAPGFTGPTRGQDGPIHVDLPRERDPLCDVFLQAALGSGYALNPDYNSGDQEGFGYYQVTHKAGRRSSVLGGYLKKARQRPNLTVQTDSHVLRLILEERRCVGVELSSGNKTRKVFCGIEVILCAGAIQSPQILELSGIGAEPVLRRAGIAIRHVLPGVGENFRDHFAVRMKWRVTQPITFNERTRGLALFKELAQYLVARRGVLSLPIAMGYGFLRSSPAESRPDLQFHFAPATYGPHSTRRLDTLPGMTLGVYKLRPESRGSIHVRSADPQGRPVIQPNFMSDESDRQCLLAGMRIARDIIANPAFDAYRAQELTPGINEFSDEQLTDFARSAGDTSYHPIGTCRMGYDANAVVDHRLRVHGMAGLRVIDASVMPSFISGNTNAATLMIAEKGANMVLEDRTAQAAIGLSCVKSMKSAISQPIPVSPLGSPFVQIYPGDPQDPQVLSLLRRSEDYAYSLYPTESVHMLAVEALAEPNVHFLVARRVADGEPVGCGAVVIQSSGYAEIKRMFVDASARRRGVGLIVLNALERLARDAQVSRLMLETGPEQPHAIALYRQEGFCICGPFGNYRLDPHSVFMEKLLHY